MHDINFQKGSKTNKKFHQSIEVYMTWIGSQMIPSLDINECETGDHNCDQDCHNTIGGYYCSCPEGYRVQQGQCVGELINGGVLMLEFRIPL